MTDHGGVTDRTCRTCVHWDLIKICPETRTMTDYEIDCKNAGWCPRWKEGKE